MEDAGANYSSAEGVCSVDEEYLEDSVEKEPEKERMLVALGVVAFLIFVFV